MLGHLESCFKSSLETKKNRFFQLGIMSARPKMVFEAPDLIGQLKTPLFFPPLSLGWKTVMNSSMNMSWLPAEMALKINTNPIRQDHILGLACAGPRSMVTNNSLK